MRAMVDDAAFNTAFDAAMSENAPAPAGQADLAESFGNTDNATPGSDDGTDENPTFGDDGIEQLDLDELRKGYYRQSDYTKKTQALAEERRLIAEEKQQLAERQQQLAVYADFERMVAENPRQAYETLSQIQQQMAGTLGLSPAAPAAPAGSASPYDDPLQEGLIPESPETRFLLQRLAQMEQQLTTFQSQQYQETASQALKSLEQSSGIPLTPLSRADLIQRARASGLPIDQVFHARYHTQILENAVRKARDEAAQVVSRKAQSAPPPGGITGRPPAAGGPPPKMDTVDDVIQATMKQMGITR